jgi:hypothetical protein
VIGVARGQRRASSSTPAVRSSVTRRRRDAGDEQASGTLILTKLFYTGPSLATLHEEYAKRHRIDSNAPVTSSSALEVHAPIERVWQAIADVRAWPPWARHVAVLEVDAVRPDSHLRWRLNGVPIRSRFAIVDPHRELSWTGVTMGFKAVDRQVLERVDAEHTRVTVEESLAGPLLPLPYRASKLRSNHETWLGALKRFVETR